MYLPRFRFATFALTVCLLIGTVRVSLAGTRKYPSDAPVFTFEIPEDWTSEEKADETKTLACTMGSDDNVGLLVLTLPKAYTAEEMKTFLPAMAKGQFESQKLTDIEIREPGKDTVGGTPVTYVVARGTSDGTPVVYTFIGYSPTPGKSFELEYIIPAKDFEKRIPIIQKILGSFKTAK